MASQIEAGFINQQKRFNSMSKENFYLLNITKEPSNFILNISGSSRNIYQIVVNEELRTINCNCPDSKGWAKHYNCVCKHSCFVLFKVCNDTITLESDFFQHLRFNIEDFAKITEKLLEKFVFFNSYEFLRSNDDIVSIELLDRFQKLQLEDNEEKTYEPKKAIKKEEQCPICMQEFKEEEEEHLECPECNNILHKTCMEQWLNIGHQTCVYCRSECWKDYFQDYESEYKNLGY